LQATTLLRHSSISDTFSWTRVVNISETALTGNIEIERYAERSRAEHFANEAVDAALRKAWSDAAAKLSERQARALDPAEKPRLRIGITNRGRIVFAHLSNILAVVAQGNYVVLQRESGSFRLRESISVMAERLEPYNFVRIHRSVLVNRDWVEEIRPRATGDYLLRLKGGKEFTVTRTYKKNLRMLAELWLGNESLFTHPEIA
jgi:DNA-binding LytR/AlgR family response regulator